MDQDRYQPTKRRRTSSADSSSSRNAPARRPQHRHPETTRVGQETTRRRDYSSSRSRAGSETGTPQRRRSRSRSQSRRRVSRSSSIYDTADEEQGYPERRQSRTRRQSPSRSRSRSRSPSRSRSRSRSRFRSYASSVDDNKPPPASPTPAKSSKSLNFIPLVTIPRAHARGITSLKFSPDMTLLATASADNTINIYAVPSNPVPGVPFKLLRTLRAHLAGVNAIAWSAVGPPYSLASASDDKSILLWSPLASDFPISPSPITGHSNYVYSLAFSPKGNMLVSGSYDEAIFLWDVRAGRIMRQLPAHSDPVGGVDFIRDGTMVCSCAADGLIRIWDAITGQCLRTLVDEDRRPVTSVRFTPNGKYLLAWTLDSSIRLWRYVDGSCLKTYQGHVNKEYSLGGAVGNYYPNGQWGGASEAFVVSGSEDGDVLVWDITSKDLLWRGKGHRDVVLGVDYGRTRDGKGLLVSGGKDRDVRIWMIDSEETEEEQQARRKSGQQAGENDMDLNMTMDMDDAMDHRDGVGTRPLTVGRGGTALNGEAVLNGAMNVDTPPAEAMQS